MYNYKRKKIFLHYHC